MVPPWVTNPPSPAAPDAPGGEVQVGNEGGEAASNPPVPTNPIELAPTGRFRSARISLKRFAQTGGASSLRRAVGNYFRSGQGGSFTATRRLAPTARTAERLYSTLSAMGAGQRAETGSPVDRSLLQGQSAQQILDAVIEAVRPVDGTQDGESNRKAMHDAMSEVLRKHPDADLLDLTEAQKALAVEAFIANDVFQRFMLDLGTTIKAHAPTALLVVARLNDVKNYIRQVVASSFRKLVTATNSLRSRNVADIVRRTLKDAIDVFEEYLT